MKFAWYKTLRYTVKREKRESVYGYRDRSDTVQLLRLDRLACNLIDRSNTMGENIESVTFRARGRWNNQRWRSPGNEQRTVHLANVKALSAQRDALHCFTEVCVSSGRQLWLAINALVKPSFRPLTDFVRFQSFHAGSLDFLLSIAPSSFQRIQVKQTNAHTSSFLPNVSCFCVTCLLVCIVHFYPCTYSLV